MAEAPLDNRRRVDISLTDLSDEASMMSGLVSRTFLLYFSIFLCQPPMSGRTRLLLALVVYMTIDHAPLERRREGAGNVLLIE